MSFDKELVSIQYSLALLIGQDLDVKNMLKQFLPSALRLLGSSGGAVWLKQIGQTEFEFEMPVYSYPNLKPNAKVQFARILEQLNTDFNAQEELPVYTREIIDNNIFYQFPLNHIGAISIRRASELPEKYLLAMKPIFNRLATACFACLEHEALAKAEQKALESMKKAEEANKAKTEFLSTMSHELRTPLHGILGLSSLSLDEDISPEQRDNLKSIKSSAKGLLAIIDDILDMSLIETRSLRLSEENFLLVPMLENTIRPFSARAIAKGLAFYSDISNNINHRVIADSNRLKQILIVLLDNAIKYTDNGEVRFSVDDHESTSDKLNLKFDVKDTGIGISQFDKDKIFSTFTQAEGSHKRSYGGIGLGLTISAQLAALMGGNVSVESTPGKGSTFSLHIALKRASEEGTITNYKNTVTGSARVRVLLAEDNPVNRKVAQKVLEKGGHEVLLAHNGKEAVEKWEEENPDLILMDIQMPEMDGLEATEVIRAKQKHHVPIIALTANAKDSDQHACFKVGMDYFIAKPFSPKKLLAIIHDALSVKTEAG